MFLLSLCPVFSAALSRFIAFYGGKKDFAMNVCSIPLNDCSGYGVLEMGVHLSGYLRQCSVDFSADYTLHSTITVGQRRLSSIVFLCKGHLSRVCVRCHNPRHSCRWNIHKIDCFLDGCSSEMSSLSLLSSDRSDIMAFCWEQNFLIQLSHR